MAAQQSFACLIFVLFGLYFSLAFAILRFGCPNLILMLPKVIDDF